MFRATVFSSSGGQLY